VNPTDVLTSQNPIVQFKQAKKYTIHLWVKNDRGTDSTMYLDYVDVGSYDQPNVINSGDASNGIGISRITLNGGGIDTTFSSPYSPKSQYITGTTNQMGRLFKGVNYSVSVQRPNNNAAADYKVWIDFNRNGSFDASEEVLSKINSSNLIETGVTFRVGNNQVLGTMRMRVGVGLSNTYPFSKLFSNLHGDI
jgi:PKD repeat protein